MKKANLPFFVSVMIVLILIALLMLWGCIPTGEHQRRWILYSYHRAIWAMDENGENEHILWDCEKVHCGWLSPDGTMMAYMVETKDDKYIVGITNRDGKATELVRDLSGQDFTLAWSFDARYMALLVQYDRVEREHNELYIVDITTGQQKLIEKGVISIEWSPISNRIAMFDGYGRGEQFGWYAVNYDGGQEKEVLTGEITEAFQWSPDGKLLAVVKVNSKGRTSLFIGESNGQNMEEVTTGEQYKYAAVNYPRWSPDSKEMLYIAEYDDPTGERKFDTLFNLNVETGEQTPLVGEVEPGSAIWSPDASRIAYLSNIDHNFYIIAITDRTIKKLAASDEVTTLLRWE